MGFIPDNIISGESRNPTGKDNDFVETVYLGDGVWIQRMTLYGPTGAFLGFIILRVLVSL